MGGKDTKTRSKTRPGDDAEAWKGKERRGKAPRRHDSRRLDQRRLAGIGEIMDDRRGGERGKGRRTSDRRTKMGRRDSE